MSKYSKNISLLLLICLAVLPVCFSVYFLSTQAYIRHAMEEELENRESETIILSRKNIHWIEKDKELLIGDHLFDVKKIIILSNDSVYVEGLFDFKEDALYASLEQSLFTGKSEKTNTIFPLVFFQFIFENTDINSLGFNLSPFYNKAVIPYQQEFSPLVYYTVDYPPPNT